MTLEENIRAILECNFTGYKDEIIDIAIKNIMSLSDIENQKTGHWIKHENPNLGQCMRVTYECSYCKVWLGCEYFVRKSYCPNCGAKMEGE